MNFPLILIAFLTAGPVVCADELPAPVPPVENSPILDQEEPPPVPPLDFTVDRGLAVKVNGRPDFLDQINFMLPTGRVHRGVRLPAYRPLVKVDEGPRSEQQRTTGEAATIASLFQSDMLTRLDSNHLQFEGAILQNFDDPETDNDESQLIRLERAVYDLQNDLLMSTHPVTIVRGNMTINAEGMLRDNASKLTSFTGGVRITILQPDDEEKPATEKADPISSANIIAPVAPSVEPLLPAKK